MRTKTVQITDKNGNTFKMKISTTTSKGRIASGALGKVSKRLGDALAGVMSGDWQTLDKGFIRYHSGETRSRLTENGDMTTRDLLILGEEGIKAYDDQGKFGMQLFEYEDVLGVNTEGEGFVIQPWVISLTPGRIKWSVV